MREEKKNLNLKTMLFKNNKLLISNILPKNERYNILFYATAKFNKRISLKLLLRVHVLHASNCVVRFLTFQEKHDRKRSHRNLLIEQLLPEETPARSSRKLLYILVVSSRDSQPGCS